VEFKDYYQVLGVPRGATAEDIKRAHRQMARKLHPDVSKVPDTEERFKELGEAYEVLKDPEKRAAYDRLGANWKSGQDFTPPPEWDSGVEFPGGFNEGDATQFSDFFESLFGRRFRTAGGGRATIHVQGEDRHARVSIDLEDAYTGPSLTMTLHVPEVDGQGRVSMRERRLSVKIPRGIGAGQHIRLAGQGDPGLGQGPPGDLYLEVEFRPHPRYRVERHDVFVDLPVSPWEAALGAAVKVPTPNGIVELKIPAGSAAGAKLRLKGQGIPASTPGDLYVVLNIVLPPADTEGARAAYRHLAEQFATFDPRVTMGART